MPMIDLERLAAVLDGRVDQARAGRDVAQLPVERDEDVVLDAGGLTGRLAELVLRSPSAAWTWSVAAGTTNHSPTATSASRTA